MSTDKQKIVSHAGVYAFGNIIRNIASFLMLPIYTRYLTPEDYGVIELLSMMIDFASIILGMKLADGIFRFYCDTDDLTEKHSVIATSVLLAGLLSGMGVLLIVGFAGPISNVLFGNQLYTEIIIIFAAALFFSALIEVGMTYIRAQQRPWLFVILGVVKLVSQLSLNIYFVVIKGMHVEGVIYSSLISSFIMAVILLTYTFRNVGFSISSSIVKNLVRFSYPLMLSSLLSFYLTFGDRYFLRIFTDLSEVGLYALGYKFGFMLLMLTSGPFGNIWASQRYLMYKEEGAKEKFGKIFLYMNIATIFIALGIAIFVEDLLKIMAAKEFISAYQIVPIILLAYVIQSWNSFCNFGILLSGKTIEITKANVLAVVAITCLYLTLIPAFGAIGAAWATVIAFFVKFLWINYKSNQHFKMDLNWFKVALTLFSAIAVYCLSIFAPEPIVYSLMFRVLLMLAFALLILYSPILDVASRDSIKIAIGRLVRFGNR